MAETEIVDVEVKEEDTPVEVDDSDFAMPGGVEAEILGRQAYQVIIQYNQAAMNEKAVRSVGNRQKADEIAKELQVLRNQLGFIYRKCPGAKAVAKRFMAEDQGKLDKPKLSR